MKFSHGALAAAALVAVGLGAWTASTAAQGGAIAAPEAASAAARSAASAPSTRRTGPVGGVAPAARSADPAATPVVPTLAAIAGGAADEASATAIAPVAVPGVAAAPAASIPTVTEFPAVPVVAAAPAPAAAPAAAVPAAAAGPVVGEAAPGNLITFGTGGFCMLPGPPPGMWSNWAGNNTYQWYLFSPGMYVWDGTGEPSNTSGTNVYTNGIPVSYSGTDAASCGYSIRYITTSGTDLDNPPTSGTLFFPGAVFAPQVAYLPITTGAPPTGSNPTYMHVLGDVLWEGAETCEVVLKNPINSALGDLRSAMVTILDYQASTCSDTIFNPSLGVCFFRFPEVRVAENGQGSPLASKTLNCTIFVHRQHSVPPNWPMPVTIQFDQGSSTAILGTDFNLPGLNPFTVILPGPPIPVPARYTTSFTITLAPDDTAQDGHKTAVFKIISPNNNLVGMDIGVSYNTTGQATGVQDTCTVLIIDNESPDPITGAAPTGSLGGFGSGIDNGCGGGSGLAALAGLGLALGLWRLRRRS